MRNYCLINGIHCSYANEVGSCAITACRKVTETAKWNNTHSQSVVYNITTVKTNADRIRAMTDDELADFFFESPEIEFGVCYYCKNFGGAGSPEPCKTTHGCCDVEDKNEAFKKWLKQPTKV
jgi:hypothetical protein